MGFTALNIGWDATRSYCRAQDVKAALFRYAWVYNHQFPHKALGRRALDAMKDAMHSKPQIKEQVENPLIDSHIHKLTEIIKDYIELNQKTNSIPAAAILRNIQSKTVGCLDISNKLARMPTCGAGLFGKESSSLISAVSCN